MDVIVINQLQKLFRGKRGAKVEALRGISLTVGQGEVFGFLGPNGAGKSTTIKCLMGLIAPSGGNGTIDGEPIGSKAARSKVGFLPENPAFYDFLTAQEYLDFVGKVCGMSRQRLAERSEQVLHKLELWEARKRPIRSFSKGMVQRVGIAQALLHEPDIYIFDEPMSGLDPLGRALVKDIILELKEAGKTVFFSTHILDDVEKICDRVAIILKGEVQYLGEVEDILLGGISGYQIRSRNPENGAINDVVIAKEELDVVLNQMRESGEEVLLVEPNRHNLEDFFLEIVKRT